MYCTVANAIESVGVDGFLDVPQIVRQLQVRRPAFIANMVRNRNVLFITNSLSRCGIRENKYLSNTNDCI